MTRRLLKANPALRELLTAQLVSEAGSWIAYVALTVAVYAQTGSAAWVSAVLLAGFVPSVALAPLVGRLVDRVPRRRLLIAADLSSALVFTALLFVERPVPIIALALAAGAATAVFRPALSSSLPNLVREEDLAGANSVLQATATLGLALGPALAGILVAATGTGVAFAANAASFVVSALLVARLPGARFQSSAGGDAPSASGGGFRVFAEQRMLRVLLVTWVLASFAAAAVNVGEILIAKETFGAGTVGFGLIASSCGAGLVLGSLASARVLGGREPFALYAAGLALAAAAFGAAAAAPALWVAAPLALAGGFGNGLLIVGKSLVLQRAVPDALRGRAFAVLFGAGNAALGVGMVLAGAVGAGFGARVLWEIGAVLLAVAAVATLSVRPALRPARTEAV